jgi:riboflavin transporter FmnP
LFQVQGPSIADHFFTALKVVWVWWVVEKWLWHGRPVGALIRFLPVVVLLVGLYAAMKGKQSLGNMVFSIALSLTPWLH